VDRAQAISSAQHRPEVSVLIVGGGINGIGVYRELALNGVDVLLVERGDFCSGSSAASSHMAHGGIRYLENGEFRLVREAVQERNRLLRNAPHLVKPLPTTIPIFKRLSGLLNAPLRFLGLRHEPSERGALVIRLGLFLYDLFAGRAREVPRHRFHGRAASLKRWPALNPKLLCSATYFDAAILSPERLAIELLLDGEVHTGSARALNYVRLVGGQAETVQLRDEMTGQIIEVRPRLLINAAGPWIDVCNRSLGHSSRLMRGTKGSHLVLHHPILQQALGDHEFFFENRDGRIVLLLPLYDRVLVGTSDLPIVDPDEARCTEAEIAYFLAMVGRIFPGVEIRPEHIVFRFSGVRPLANHSPLTPGQISRDHSIHVASPASTGLAFPVYSMVGGKWTSFRAFSEEAAGMALEYLGLPRRVDTRDLPIGGGRGYVPGEDGADAAVHKLSGETGLSPRQLRPLVDRYGSRAQVVAEFIRKGADAPLASLPQVTVREIEFLARNEKVVHLDDLVLRRTTLAVLGHLTMAVLHECAEAVGQTLDWSRDQIRAEVSRTTAILADRHGVKL
jgi:glycerol-3-phosphate dehydrogenase